MTQEDRRDLVLVYGLISVLLAAGILANLVCLMAGTR